NYHSRDVLREPAVIQAVTQATTRTIRRARPAQHSYRNAIPILIFDRRGCIDVSNEDKPRPDGAEKPDEKREINAQEKKLRDLSRRSFIKGAGIASVAASAGA